MAIRTSIFENALSCSRTIKTLTINSRSCRNSSSKYSNLTARMFNDGSLVKDDCTASASLMDIGRRF